MNRIALTMMALLFCMVTVAKAQEAKQRPKVVRAPAGNLVVSEEGDWIRFEGEGLKVNHGHSMVTLSYENQSASFRSDDVVVKQRTVKLRKGAAPLVVNGKEVPQESSTELSSTCRCTQCVLFLEYCCIPYRKYLGFCLGTWGCNSTHGAGCG
jgi:hypothetical protein